MVGYLVLIGGAEDREIFKHIFSLKKIKKVVIIPTALKKDPVSAANSYLETFKKFNIETVEILDIRDKEECLDKKHINTIEDTGLFFFTGGDQERLSNIFLDTPLFKKIQKMHSDGSIVAGTSAGAAIIGEQTIFDGDYRGFYKNAVCVEDGFGFLGNVIVDTHFLKRARIPRLIQGLIETKMGYGIGVGEDTALIVQNNIGSVVGSGEVVFIDISKHNSNINTINENEKFSVDNINISFLFENSRFDLKNWKLL